MEHSSISGMLGLWFKHFNHQVFPRTEQWMLVLPFLLQTLCREEVFVTSKLWNTKHDPEDVEEACRTSLAHLGLSYLDLYLMHWPIAFQWAAAHNNLILSARGCQREDQCEVTYDSITSAEATFVYVGVVGGERSWCLGGRMEVFVTLTHTTEILGQPWRALWIKVWSKL